jgi:hypothetical protein
MSRILPVLILVALGTASAQVSTTTIQPILPDQFTASDLRAALGLAAAGVADPSQLISALARHASQSVVMIRDLLYDESVYAGVAEGVFHSIPAGSVRRFAPVPPQALLVLALQACGSAEAYAYLFRAATNHPSAQVRGLSLYGLAHGFRDKAKIRVIQPDKALLYLFLSNGSDTTYIGFLEKSTAQVAREGLRYWTGKDGGWPLPVRVRVVPAANRPSGIPEYWQFWWRTRSPRITWDAEKAVFVLPR